MKTSAYVLAGILLGAVAPAFAADQAVGAVPTLTAVAFDSAGGNFVGKGSPAWPEKWFIGEGRSAVTSLNWSRGPAGPFSLD